MSDFKGRHLRGEIVLWAVRWHCRYAISYRDLEARIVERSFGVGPCVLTEAMAWLQDRPASAQA